MENKQSCSTNKQFLDVSLQKLDEINNTHVKLANHWLKLKGLYEQDYIECLVGRAENDKRILQEAAAIRIQEWWRRIDCVRKLREQNTSELSKENCFQSGVNFHIVQQEQRLDVVQQMHVQEIIPQSIQNLCREEASKQIETNVASEEVVINEIRKNGDREYEKEEKREKSDEEQRKLVERAATTKIQAWWRGIIYRRNMLSEHRERLQQCIQEIRNAPCSEANPKEERQVPLNQRIERCLGGLLSSILTERKAMAIRLNRLASRSHVSIECMLNKRAFEVILESLSQMNRSEAHLYVIRPLCELVVKFLQYKPFVEPFAQQCLDSLCTLSVKLIHNNYKDRDVAVFLSEALVLLLPYPGFKEKMCSSDLAWAWYMQKFQRLFGAPAQDSTRRSIFRKLCRVNRHLTKGENDTESERGDGSASTSSNA